MILDEVAWWQDTPGPRTLLDSLLSSAAKVEGCRVVVITSPSSPAHFAYRLRQHAADDPLWRLSEETGAPRWLDPERVEEQRRRLPEAMFARLFEGRWMDGDEALAVSGDVAPRYPTAARSILSPASPTRWAPTWASAATGPRGRRPLGGERVVV